jgi:hypothetical protein
LLHIHIVGLRQIYSIAEHGNSKTRTAAVIGMYAASAPGARQQPPSSSAAADDGAVDGHHSSATCNGDKRSKRVLAPKTPPFTPPKRRTFTTVFWYGMSTGL